MDRLLASSAGLVSLRGRFNGKDLGFGNFVTKTSVFSPCTIPTFGFPFIALYPTFLAGQTASAYLVGERPLPQSDSGGHDSPGTTAPNFDLRLPGTVGG